jgi:hypothetical protein
MLCGLALRLLGVDGFGSRTLHGVCGAFIVLFACVAFCHCVSGVFMGSGALKKNEPDLYTQVKGEIAAEKRIKESQGS